MVDAIVDDNSRCSGWSQAKITQASGDLLHLEFVLDTKSTDRFIDRWSVEIAPYESKTKDLFDWKKTLKVNDVVDAHDKSSWNKSTILDMKEQQISPDRTAVPMAFIAYRIYMEKGSKSDERGAFEGWSSRFDEWISLYSPRIQPFFSKTQKGGMDEIDLDDEMDNLMKAEDGMDRVFGVPRIRKCTSSLYLKLLNLFGNRGGFDIALETLQKQSTNEDGTYDLNLMASLM